MQQGSHLGEQMKCIYKQLQTSAAVDSIRDNPWGLRNAGSLTQARPPCGREGWAGQQSVF